MKLDCSESEKNNKIKRKKVVLGASIGNCVHVAGVVHFLGLAENEGYEAHFLGPAVTIEKLFYEIDNIKPDIVGISYRLTPANVVALLDKINDKIRNGGYKNLIWAFAGTLPVARYAKKYKFIKFVSDGNDDLSDSIYFLRFLEIKAQKKIKNENDDQLISRLNESYPYPLLRHHFGLPSVEETIKGITQISRAKVLDIISIGPDQNAQQFFFNQERMKEEFNGAGGVPLRSREEFLLMKEASKCGNFPLMRCYSGTEDVFEYADLLLSTINNAWAAIPLCWYNELDGRGTRKLSDSLDDAQKLIKWHAEKNIPVEINEPHHWSLRDAHDVISVVMGYISAYNAKKMGVKNYIAQYMFNVPNSLSFPMDLARITAMDEMICSLKSESFNVIKQTRAGLPFLSGDLNIAKGQLASTTFMQMAINPHIIHVVGYCEAYNAARPKEIIESCKIVKGTINSILNHNFSLALEPCVIERKEELISEAKVLLNFILNKYNKYIDPLANTEVLTDCIKNGYIDAVHILKNTEFHGNLSTKVIDGKCLAYDKISGQILSEEERLNKLINICK